ncbi:hypothetical protein P7K49_013296, partial [Saguinus oedipus]
MSPWRCCPLEVVFLVGGVPLEVMLLEVVIIGDNVPLEMMLPIRVEVPEGISPLELVSLEVKPFRRDAPGGDAFDQLL